MSGPLVGTAWLADHLDEVMIADCRSHGSTRDNRRAYDSGHLPGAIFFDMESDLVGPGEGRHPLPDAAGFAALLGRRGISNDDVVVVYDDTDGGAACRLWWMIRSLGGTAVMLDGGITDWVRFDRPLSCDEPAFGAVVFATDGWSGVVSAEELIDQLDKVTLVDARSEERFRGENEPLDPIAGHIPGAVNKPYTANIDDYGFVLDPAQLAEIYADVEGDVVAYCGSGVTACHTLLALELAGLGGARLYPGSWSGWITDPARPRA